MRALKLNRAQFAQCSGTKLAREIVHCKVFQALPVFDLTEPSEFLSVLSLHGDEFSHHISVMHVDSTDGTDLLTVTLVQVTNKQVNQGYQLGGLFLVVILQSVLVTFF